MQIYFFILGLAVGSFLNSVIYRLEQGQSFLQGRSFCPHCQHKLSWQDLIPVFSFIVLLGKCRYCRKPISIQYPLVELATGLLFALIFMTFGWPLSIFYFLISIFLVIIFVYDLKHYIIPDKVIFPAIGFAFFGHWYLFGIWYLIFGILPSLFFLAIIVLSREKWMGFGDFKLAVLMGLFLGWPNIIPALFSAVLLGAIIGVGLMAARKKTMKSAVPFGPFLVFGTFLALFAGEKIINFYLNLLG